MIKIICDGCDLTIEGKWRPSFDSGNRWMAVDDELISSLKKWYPKVLTSGLSLCKNCVDLYEQVEREAEDKYIEKMEQIELEKEERLKNWLEKRKTKS